MTQISSDLTYGIIFVCQLKVNISYFLIFLPDDEAQFLSRVSNSTLLRLCEFLFATLPELLPHSGCLHCTKWRSKNDCYGLPDSCSEFWIPVILDKTRTRVKVVKGLVVVNKFDNSG